MIISIKNKGGIFPLKVEKGAVELRNGVLLARYFFVSIQGKFSDNPGEENTKRRKIEQPKRNMIFSIDWRATVFTV